MPRTPVSSPGTVVESFPENSVILRDAQSRQWLVLTDPCQIICAWRVEEVVACLREVENAVTSHGLIAAGFVGYEAASAFDSALPVSQDHTGFPLLWFALYPRERSMPLPLVQDDFPLLAWQTIMTREDYRAALERIHHYIAAGDTYQVNFSYRLLAPYSGTAWPLFRQLASSHDPEFGAYLNIGRWEILSLSPELFFRRQGNLLSSLPMKGTIGRGLSAEDDRLQGVKLHNSAKDRAENVMIVDMVRNDLARIADPGSIRVKDMFAVRRYSTLWQMTSTVTARSRASLTDSFAALFPAASITGAPKARTMALIRELETTPRRIYTGAIGFLMPDGRAQFNVAIRTLLYDHHQKMIEYGVGGGITADSSIPGEWEETRVKSLVCRAPLPEFCLIETLRWTGDGGLYLLEEHMRRLRASAEYFAYPCDVKAIERLLVEAVDKLSGPGYKLRMLLDRRGTVRIESAPLPASGGNHLMRLVLAQRPVDRRNPALYHKTTQREVYEQARAAAPQNIDDVLLFNQDGALTETTIANIVVTLDGRQYTPPVCCGLLPGTYRQHLLDIGEIEERCLDIDCLAQADAITLINSVRGRMPACLGDSGCSVIGD
ncbi:MAG: aminodeoxychorismate synthase component I [Desulfobulbus sp.]|nr:aminodeoxychorismate synthase component I [Desulfobulbus sp.]